MLHAIQNGMKLLAADEIRRLNDRIEARSRRMASLRTMQQILRRRHNEDLRHRADLLSGLEQKLDAAPASAGGFDAVDQAIDQRRREENEAMDALNGGGDDCISQFDAGGEA